MSTTVVNAAEGTATLAGLRGRVWRRFLRGPDQALLEELYVPALAEATRYDRCCAYFSSSVLAAAARGFGALITRLAELGNSAPRPSIRLLVNEELDPADVRALTESGDTSKLEALLLGRFKSPGEALEKQRLEMLAWLVKQGLLDVRVGVMRRGEGIVHAKFGVVTDTAGDAIVFAGSGNESASGLRANYEQLEVSTSWGDPDRYDEYKDEFERLWSDTHSDVHTVPLPEALRLKLVRLAPKDAPTAEPSNALARQKAAIVWRFLVEAPYLPNGALASDATAYVDLWPHQKQVVADAADAWPDGRLLCDEVGMGKTIEAVLILRRLLAGRGVKRVLILPPAGLLKQWQAELREKGGLVVPRLENSATLVWPDGRQESVPDLASALKQDLLLMSRELARLEGNQAILLSGPTWDLVLLDEAHAARRRQQVEGEYNSATLLLTLLRELQLKRKTRGFLLLSATPMQTHPWEPWDLLAVLGEGNAWLAEFAAVRNYYGAVATLQQGGIRDETLARHAAELVVSDPSFPSPVGFAAPNNVPGLVQKLRFPLPTARAPLARWLQKGSPLVRRMHRNTRDTLREYYRLGLIPNPPPRREIDDVAFDYADPAEREVYDAITSYIEKRFSELESEKPGKGFVMTIYRRRAASSPFALDKSLTRRLDGLQRVANRMTFEEWLSGDESLDQSDLGDLSDADGLEKISAAYPTDPGVARAEAAEVERLLARVRALGGRDTKRDWFYDKLRQLTDDGRSILVFTEYADTLEYLRDSLVAYYGTRLGCYSGAGGQLWVGTDWQSVTKDVVAARLQNGELQVLLCTDAASEGLNLQAAGGVINYDLPWNPSKVEQRIGRIDRIGQKRSAIDVVNFFLKDSIDQQVYKVLQARCGLFRKFIGPMQPVLAQARRMLAGQQRVDPKALESAARQAQADAIGQQTYVESDAAALPAGAAPVTLAQVEDALQLLDGSFGPRAKHDRKRQTWSLSGSGIRKVELGTKLEVLERSLAVTPFSLSLPQIRQVADLLDRTGERLPLVIGSAERGPFRASAAVWVGESGVLAIQTLDALKKRLSGWNGRYPTAERWIEATNGARLQAQAVVDVHEREARERELAGLSRQVGAARRRLELELGRYLACFQEGIDDLNGVLSRQMTRDTASADRLRRCLKNLRGYPEWPAALCQELGEFAANLAPYQRQTRLTGKVLDAALNDPRWEAQAAIAPPAR